MAWETLENAGYDPETYKGSIGVFAGSALSGYFLFNLTSNPELIRSVGGFQIGISNDKDHLATRRLLQAEPAGPSFACRRPARLAGAVHMACQSLLKRTSATWRWRAGLGQRAAGAGYLYQEGITRPTATAAPSTPRRAAPSAAAGRRRGRAQAAGRRASPTATTIHARHPRLGGQQRRRAQGGLHRAQRRRPGRGDRAGPGGRPASPRRRSATSRRTARHAAGRPHRDRGAHARSSAAEHRQGATYLRARLGQDEHRPPRRRRRGGRADQGRARRSSTQIAAEPALPSRTRRSISPPRPSTSTPRCASGRADGTPRRAGVSSFGIGGTNAHVVLEQAPEPVAGGAGRRWQSLVVSAKSGKALEATACGVARHLETKRGAGVGRRGLHIEGGPTGVRLPEGDSGLQPAGGHRAVGLG